MLFFHNFNYFRCLNYVYFITIKFKDYRSNNFIYSDYYQSLLYILRLCIFQMNHLKLNLMNS